MIMIIITSVGCSNNVANEVLNIQCKSADDEKVNMNLEVYPGCKIENSCIVTGLNTNENLYAFDRTVVHESKCLILINSVVNEIPSNIFMTLKSNLTHLYANNISIGDLRRISFPFAQKLEKIDLSRNILKELLETAFYDAPNLLELNLSYNLINTLSSNVFEKLENLQILDLSYNQISTIPFESFQPLGNNLVYLNLRNNRLNLKFGIFPENVTELDLSYNNLEIQLKFKIFSLLKKLNKLLVHGNRIEGIHQSIYDSNLSYIGLSNNLFSCNVLADIILSLNSHNIQLILENSIKNTSNIYGIKCFE